jgi:hypothetical protein
MRVEGMSIYWQPGLPGPIVFCSRGLGQAGCAFASVTFEQLARVASVHAVFRCKKVYPSAGQILSDQRKALFLCQFSACHAAPIAIHRLFVKRLDSVHFWESGLHGKSEGLSPSRLDTRLTVY